MQRQPAQVAHCAQSFPRGALSHRDGDQWLFLTKALLEEMGGFADLPIMEDYEFSARLRRRGRILTVGEPALTSARRWQTLGVVRTTLRNQWMLVGYHLGVSPQKLAMRYRALGR